VSRLRPRAAAHRVLRRKDSTHAEFFQFKFQQPLLLQQQPEFELQLLVEPFQFLVESEQLLLQQPESEQQLQQFLQPVFVQREPVE